MESLFSPFTLYKQYILYMYDMRQFFILSKNLWKRVETKRLNKLNNNIHTWQNMMCCNISPNTTFRHPFNGPHVGTNYICKTYWLWSKNLECYIYDICCHKLHYDNLLQTLWDTMLDMDEYRQKIKSCCDLR